MTVKECFAYIDEMIDPKHREQFVVVRDINQTGSDDCVVRHTSNPLYYLWHANGQIVGRRMQNDTTISS